MNMSSVVLSETIAAVLDHVSFLKIYMDDDSKEYVAEVYTTRKYYDVTAASVEDLFHQIATKVGG